MPTKVIIDVDTGIDDALALMLALRCPELDLLGVTCVAGNATLQQVTQNTLAVLELAEARAPVAVGARKPLVNRLRTATLFHGANGIGNARLPVPRHHPIEENAVHFLSRMARMHAQEIVVIAVGPLTNIALTVLADPEFAHNVRQLIVMGGAVHTAGNVNGVAEANFANDPEAASIVADAGAPLHLVDLGATHQVVLPLECIGTPVVGPPSSPEELARQMLHFYARAYVEAGSPGPVLHDPLAVALAVDPTLAVWKPMHLAVETRGEFTRGASIASFSSQSSRITMVEDYHDVVGWREQQHNAHIARDINVERFLRLFTDKLGLG